MNLVNWLNTPPKNTFWLILKAAAFYLAYALAWTTLQFIIEQSTGFSLDTDWQGLGDKGEAETLLYIVLMFIGAPINSVVEELIFRAPLTIAGKFFPRGGTTVAIAIGSSVIFGWIHGGIVTIPMQGVMGLVLSACYLKCGGQDGKFWKPFLVTVTIHTLANWILLTLGGGLMIVIMVFE